MYKTAADLQQYIVDRRLYFKTQRVAGIFLVQNELVVDAEVRHGRNGTVVLRCHLVTISLHLQTIGQLLQLLPAINPPTVSTET